MSFDLYQEISLGEEISDNLSILLFKILWNDSASGSQISY
jgi:hypothetical protein